MTKREIAMLRRRVEKITARVGVQRDELREIEDLAKTLGDCCSYAIESLESAVQSLSEYA